MHEKPTEAEAEMSGRLFDSAVDPAACVDAMKAVLAPPATTRDPGRGTARASTGPADVIDEQAAETHRDAAPPDDPLKDPAKLTATTYGLAVIFECVGCHKMQALTDPQILRVGFHGSSFGLRCPACGHPQKLDPPRRPEEPRVVLAHPGDSLNRHARRARIAQERLRHG